MSDTDLARLRRCARILRRAYPDTKFVVQLRYRTIKQVACDGFIRWEMDIGGLDAWERAAEAALAKEQS